jgi:hypothetical protein
MKQRFFITAAIASAVRGQVASSALSGAAWDSGGGLVQHGAAGYIQDDWRVSSPGAGNVVLDLAVWRNFRLTESLAMQIRVESFNFPHSPGLWRS